MEPFRVTVTSTPSDLQTTLDPSASVVDIVDQLPLLYAILEGIVAVGASVGNLLVIIVFVQDKRLRKVTNFYIVSLAFADLLVGLVGVPSAILTRLGIPRNAFKSCVTMLSLLVILCTISILNLVAVSLDRFWAILYPLNYHRRMSSQVACGIIITCWIIGTLVGLLPLFGWNNGPDPSGKCLFIPVMHYDFLVCLYFATIVFPALVMAAFYGRIYLIVVRQVRKLQQISRTISDKPLQTGLQRSRTFPVPLSRSAQQPQYEEETVVESNGHCSEERSASTSPGNPKKGQLRAKASLTSQVIEATFNLNDVKPIRLSYSRREVKKAHKLSIIVLFFMICWIPLYTVNTIDAFWEDFNPPFWLLDTFIILSHLNSAVNPLLYAYHMKDFREAFRRLLCDCVFRPQDLRDIRRQELLSISGMNVRRNTKAANSCPNSALPTPELSPSPRTDEKGLQ